MAANLATAQEDTGKIKCGVTTSNAQLVSEEGLGLISEVAAAVTGDTGNRWLVA